MANLSFNDASQHQGATELLLGNEPAEECTALTSGAETTAVSAEIINGPPLGASDETTETQAMGGNEAALADTVREQDGWRANKNATAWDHGQMLVSRWSSIIRSQVSARKQSEVDSEVNSHGLESSTGEAVNIVDDERGLERTQQASEEEDCQQTSGESHRNETTSESKTVDTTAHIIVHEAAAVALDGDGDETDMATVDDNSFADVSDTSPTSTDGSVAPDNAQVWGGTCQKVDANASLVDCAQVFFSQSVSGVRSRVSKKNRSEEDPRASTSVSESSELANGCAQAEEAPEVASGCIEHGTPYREPATDTKLRVECEEVAAVSLEADLGMASADDNASDEASGPSSTRMGGGGVWTDDASVTDATCQEVDDHASLVDRAQVFWSQSLSAVRSKAPELTRYIKDPTENSSEASLDADASPSEEAGTEAAAFTDEMSDKTPEVGTPASVRTLESEVELQACAGTDEELPMEGSIAPPVASPTSNAATHSVPTPTSHSEEAHVNATRLDHAQVFTSLAMAALRSQVSALTRPNSALTQPSSVIVA